MHLSKEETEGRGGGVEPDCGGLNELAPSSLGRAREGSRDRSRGQTLDCSTELSCPGGMATV